MNKPKPVISLASLGLAEITEALEMEDEEVGFHIEAEMIKIASTILKGHGFTFEIPSRASSNQLYVPELDRIVLRSCMKRCVQYFLVFILSMI